MDQLDHPMRGVGDAPKDVAGARPLVAAAVGGDPVGARAEVVARSVDVDGPQRVIGRGVGQNASTNVAIMLRVNELRRAGRSSVIRRMPPSRLA